MLDRLTARLDRPAAVFAAFLLFSVVWSWPLALSPAQTLMALHFDQYPAAWLSWAAPDFFDGVCGRTMWPDGEPLVQLDSFLFLLIALPARLLLGIFLPGAASGLLLTNLFVLLGPPISAWGAERLAREHLNAAPPASLLAGLAFGFAPLATVAVLEGHVYYLLDPWLPLMALHLLRDRPADDRWAALHWSLCLLTTAYLGINASLIAAWLLGARLLAGGRRVPWGFLLISGAVGLAYAAVYLRGGGADRGTVDAASRLGSATLTTLLAWSPRIDMSRHSLAPAFGAGFLAMALLSTVAARRADAALDASAPADRRWRLWLGLGLVCMGLSVGPWLEVGVRQAPIPTPLALLPASVFDSFRFPIRFAWAGMLGLGMAAVWAAGRARSGWLWLLAGAMDVMISSGGPVRMRAHPAPVPEIYDLLPQAAILELYPDPDGLSEDLGFYQQNLSCYYQMSHGRPILERCLNTDLSKNPRRDAAREIHRLLLDDQPGLLPLLQSLRVGSVVLHADLYQPFERALIVSGLSLHLGEPLAERRDGGEWLLAWRLP